jgi:GGDEF domain-containing protein
VPTADLAAVEESIRVFAAAVVDVPHPPGVSCGIASSRGRVGSARLLFSAADKAMYAAKQDHRSGPHYVTVAVD